jgi:hypothetical protein
MATAGLSIRLGLTYAAQAPVLRGVWGAPGPVRAGLAGDLAWSLAWRLALGAARFGDWWVQGFNVSLPSATVCMLSDVWWYIV